MVQILNSQLARGTLCVLVAVVALIVTSGCQFFDDVPVKNQNPEQLVLISGTSVKYAYLQIIAVYTTNNPDCEFYDVRLFERGDMKSPQTFAIEIPVQQTGEKYEATVPLDEFQKGHCQWGLLSIWVNVRLNGDPPIKFEPHTNLMMLAQPVVYFSNHSLGVNGIRIWEHGPNPPTLRIFCVLHKDSNGNAQLNWWEDYIPGYNQNRFVVPFQARKITINLVDRPPFVGPPRRPSVQ